MAGGANSTDVIPRNDIQCTNWTSFPARSQNFRTEGLNSQCDGDLNTIVEGLYNDVGDIHCSYPGSPVGKISYESAANVLAVTTGWPVV